MRPLQNTLSVRLAVSPLLARKANIAPRSTWLLLLYYLYLQTQDLAVLSAGTVHPACVELRRGPRGRSRPRSRTPRRPRAGGR